MGADQSKELKQSAVEAYMNTPEWNSILESITANDKFELDIIILSMVSFLFKLFPFLMGIGWIMDFSVLCM